MNRAGRQCTLNVWNTFFRIHLTCSKLQSVAFPTIPSPENDARLRGISNCSVILQICQERPCDSLVWLCLRKGIVSRRKSHVLNEQKNGQWQGEDCYANMSMWVDAQELLVGMTARAIVYQIGRIRKVSVEDTCMSGGLCDPVWKLAFRSRLAGYPKIKIIWFDSRGFRGFSILFIFRQENKN